MSLLNSLKKFSKNEKVSMHIPGHKGGRGIGVSFGKNPFKIDLTELDGTDNLQNPQDILKTAQEYAAKSVGADLTYFLTGGSSLGLRAAIMGLLKDGDKILVDRMCHKAVISAITLCGAEPIFIYPEFNEEQGLYVGISADKIGCYLAENKDICGMLITSPTYYGICSDIATVARVLHTQNKFLIVDEAHGAHFPFSKHLPESAIGLGADVCIQSAHKTLIALGQASLMHIRKDFWGRKKIERTLKMIQSTSPSYLIMASLDNALRHMNKLGRHKLNNLIYNIQKLKDEVEEKTDIKFVTSESYDSGRIVADFSRIEISGHFAEEILAKEFSIYAEMSDNRYVIFIPSVANSAKDIKALKNALLALGSRRYKGHETKANKPLPKIKLSCLPKEANQREYESVELDNAIGRISAETISACPPGAAVVIPGAVIDEEVICYIKENNQERVIDVIKE